MRWWLVALPIAGLAVVAAVVVGTRDPPAPPKHESLDEMPQPGTCDVDSDPPGATIYGDLTAALLNHQRAGTDPDKVEYEIGKTPAKLDHTAGYEIEVRLDGYAPAHARVPPVDVGVLLGAHADGCRLEVRLERAR